jgi:hypothetical protein
MRRVTSTALLFIVLLVGCGGEEAPDVAESGAASPGDGPSPLPGPPGDATGGGETTYPGVTYPCVCTPPDGEPFTAEVTITRCRENPEAFELAWTGGGYGAEGVGMTFGEDLFAVVRLDEGGLDVGAYRLEEGGLAGLWTDGGGIGTEVVGEVSGEPPALGDWPDDAVFEVTGEGPGGTKYRGFLQAKPWNGAVVLRWTIGEERIPGGALPLGDWLVAGFNQGTYGVSVYEREDGGWRGWWFAPGDAGFGREALSPYAQ